MLTESYAKEAGEERSAWQMNDRESEEWFTMSTQTG